MKITRGAAACGVGAVWLLAACGVGGRATEDVARESARVSASAVFVDGAALAMGASIPLRVTGPGYTATLPNGRGTLPPIGASGTYAIADGNGDAFGTFVVESGAVVATSGVVTVGAGGLGFDTTRLASVVVPTGGLTTPANLGVYELTGVSAAFSGSPTFLLPDGAYAISDATGAHVLGSFTIAARVVSSTAGALLPAAAGVAFDRTKLASVSIPASGLSTPPSAISVRLGADTHAFTGNASVLLADGSYTIGNDALDRIYGGFDVVGHVVTAARGGVAVAGSGIAFDTTKLAVVTLAASALTTFPVTQILRVPNVSAALTPGPGPLDPRVIVPAGDYVVTDGSGTKAYGGFTVTGTTVTATSGAVTRTAAGISFDTSALAAVTIPSPAGSPGAVPLRVVDAASLVLQPPIGLPSITLHLPDGAYRATSSSGRYDYGTFTVSGRRLVSAEGGLAFGSATSVTFGCELASSFLMPPTGASSIAIPEITSGVLTGAAPQTFRFAVGNYPIIYGGHTPTPYFINVPASGAVTWSLPFATCVPPAPPGSCALFSASNATCRKPPRVQCVGTPTAPATIAGVCNGVVDDNNQLAGSCADAGGGLASCTFDGASSEALGTGTHAVSVVGTADDGAVSSCTSFVRVTCTESPLVSCVGSSSAPIPFTTAAGSCTLSIAGWGGTCDDGGDGVASCTFDGQADESLAPGSYAIAVAGSSRDGASASCTSYVTVSDGEPPIVTCAPPSTLECTGPATPISTTASCTDNCGACSTSCASGAFPVGAQTLTCAATDSGGLSSQCDTSVMIVDTTPPALTVSASPSVLWVPDHTLVPIALTLTASDVCDPSPSISCSAESSEAPLTLGSGHTDPDIVWTGGQLSLRAERSGAGSGRTYTIVCTALDASGNASSATTSVFVPHNQ